MSNPYLPPGVTDRDIDGPTDPCEKCTGECDDHPKEACEHHPYKTCLEMNS